MPCSAAISLEVVPMPSNSLPYVILVGAILLVAIAPFWITMDAAVQGITDSSAWNNTDHINNSRFDGNVEQNYKNTAEDLWYYSRVAILGGIGITALIAGRRGR